MNSSKNQFIQNQTFEISSPPTSTVKPRFLCGLTVALALVPEAVAFALAAGLPPDVGLNSAWIISVPRREKPKFLPETN